MNQEFDNALHLMEVQGGSFVKALVELYYRADSTKKPRVRAAFPEVFDEYERRFKAIQDRASGNAAGEPHGPRR